ncbi:exosortase-dependent surface protein XDP1 [Flocculibacter collagenilyticus]|uniref:exosortase-dependent surface protein XDP1 n=1 Tax=Flocculibacter collagenilyticus TaxID=2744479 RepID=UPI0018F6E176|nr:exosortase-dependent surface protein XDP1 [Flocculibacter collagenilyticus]
MKKILAVLAALAIPSVQADTQTWEWDLLGSDSNGNATSSGVGYSSVQYVDTNNADSITMTMTGWSDTVNPNDGRIAQGQLYKWGNNGWGVVGLYDEGRNDYPGHAVDNATYSCDQGGKDCNDWDYVLLSFSEAVSLTDIDIGWKWDDSDASVLYLDSGTPNFSASNSDTWADVANLWTSVGSYQLTNSYYSIANDTVGIESQYWLVGAYNNVFRNDNWSSGNDGFKLSGFKASTTNTSPNNSIPEPMSALLIMLGLGLLLLQRRSA